MSRLTTKQRRARFRRRVHQRLLGFELGMAAAQTLGEFLAEMRKASALLDAVDGWTLPDTGGPYPVTLHSSCER
jgi:hypothetical protein